MIAPTVNFPLCFSSLVCLVSLSTDYYMTFLEYTLLVDISWHSVAGPRDVVALALFVPRVLHI